ncbi:choriogenin Hminor, variant 2 [Blastomyces dermatitidis ATCC 18188]|uniref:Choriogenin Hminor n=1 Tax=Ajellomyces dermatitidis (strain ATCC 18188 / CBS 674.68) TaxID=653446 RepID=F2TRV8_AJEDA|nr:choriogenin Hminor [Blastomyces dermatitidis ATCC 18188]KMW68796.1 choriogenin Hminor, variant 1 [Blastomyces dermatitidis ATCC 18188]KMW68797.1 choriogenin Hminor, variant 2 [Blastomyces dermatitidis ATCC 18188]
MLSIPGKSARRLSSLFSLGSKDKQDDDGKASRHATLIKTPPPQYGTAQGQRAQLQPQQNRASSPLGLRHAASAQHISTNSLGFLPSNNRNVSAPLPTLTSAHDDNGNRAPRPPLNTVNPDLPDSTAERRQSWSGGGLSNMAGGLSRPASRSGLLTAVSTDSRSSKTRSWLPGKSRVSSVDLKRPERPMRAWIAGRGIEYNLNPLLSGEKVDELWDDHADTFVYLFPQNTNRGPSFKVDSSIFVSSPTLTFLARGSDPTPKFKRRTIPEELPQLNFPPTGSPPAHNQIGSLEDDRSSSASRASRDYSIDEPPQQLHLYVPVPLESDLSNQNCTLIDADVHMLILFRNLFAFLIGQCLIATPKRPKVFDIFMGVSDLLSKFEFANLDGSGLGETATSSFAAYCDELRIYDVRKSREKILEAIILGERMKFFPLYREGFIHGVGRLKDEDFKHPKYLLISDLSRENIEKGSSALQKELKIIHDKLDDFDFPSLFAGIANSTTLNEAKQVRFKNWKSAFLAFRKDVKSYYAKRFGSWPPKPGSEKNQSDKSGLSRLVLMELYQDFSDLYDMLVDRTSLTTRTADMTMMNESDSIGSQDITTRALRQVMSEYDRSTPPVQPPVPFDLPILPSIMSIRKKMDPGRASKERAKRLAPGEASEILFGSYNHASIKPTDFLANFMHFEREQAKDKERTCDDLSDYRCGQWLFMYSVLQSLPRVVIDAPDVRFSQGVEYFLSIAPWGGMPWCRDDLKSGRTWFGVADGSAVVSLPNDSVANAPDSAYRRSHCWEVAMKWANQQQMLSPVMLDGDGAEKQLQSQYPPSSTGGSVPPPPPLSVTGSSSDRQPTPLLTPGSQTPPLVSIPIPREHSPGLHPGLKGGSRASLYMGLEALPLPPSVVPFETPSRPKSHNSTMSFDDILKSIPNKNSHKSKK